MPLPLIPVAIALVAAGSGGAAGSADGLRRMRKAKRVHGDAAASYGVGREAFERRQEQLEQALVAYGGEKVDAMTGPMARFVAAYSQLENVEFDPSLLAEEIARDEVEMGDLRELDLGAMKTSMQVFTSVAAGYGVGVGAGAATTTAVGALAAASTGTAIGTLSGAAATNATLAWLGGGTIAAGGGGVAAGTMVMTGIGAVPVLLGGGAVLWYKGDKALKDAHANRAEVEEAIAKMRAARARMEHLADLAGRAAEVLVSLTRRLAAATARLEVIVERERDYSKLKRDQQADVARAASLAQVVRRLVDEPLADDEGNARSAAEHLVASLEEAGGA